MKLVYKVIRIKEFRVNGNLRCVNTSMIMANLTPHIDMRTKAVYSVKSVIHQGGIVGYYKTLTSLAVMFTSLKKIQAYIKECDQKWLQFENVEVWSKVYLTTARTTETQCNYEGKVILKHVQIRLVASNKPLMGHPPLPNWLMKIRSIYAIDTFDGLLCVWRFLAILKRYVLVKKINSLNLSTMVMTS